MKKSIFAWGLAFVGAVAIGAGVAMFVMHTRVQQPVVYDWDSGEDVGQGNIEIDTNESYPETQNGDASGSGTADVVSDNQ